MNIAKYDKADYAKNGYAKNCAARASLYSRYNQRVSMV